MKKIIFFLLFMFPLSALFATKQWEDEGVSLAVSTGYVFKQGDSLFKQVYGRGIQNILTVDACCYPWETWGIGAKLSYWRAKGRTVLFKEHTRLKEIPVTFYLRKTVNFCSGLQPYATLGGGVIVVQEKSYLGCACRHKGIGEVEIGLDYPIWNCLDITGAVRYIFPPDVMCHQKTEIGGLDVRAGIGFSF